MKKANTHELNLETLRQQINFLTSAKTALMCDCAVMQFHQEHHASGVILEVTTEQQSLEFTVEWTTAIDKNLIESTHDEEFTTEWAAMGVGLLLAQKLTNYPYIRRARKEGGFDFGLSKSADAFTFDAHLEISGIKKATRSNNLDTRLKEKKKQIKSNDLSVFIVIIEFNTPQSIFIRK